MIIRLADCAPAPWKNGRGSTRQIAVHPAAAGVDDFVWRVSIAEVDSAAPFSRFPGIDRHIVLLDGAGFSMTLDQGQTHALTTPFAPFAFAGEARVAVAPKAGPTRDFNLMVRRTRARGALMCLDTPGKHRLAAHAVLVHCARGMLQTSEGTLGTGDTWLPDGSAVTLLGDALALVVCVTAPA